MTQRFPSLCHWGAFTAVVEQGRFVRADPFALDPSPSALLGALPEVVYSKSRVARPSVREGWLKHRDRRRTGHDTYVEVDWDTALELVDAELKRVRAQHGAEGIFGGSQGWASAGRMHHAGSQLKRFLFSGGGCVDKKGNYSFGTAMFLLPHVVGTAGPVTGRVTDWTNVCGHTRLMVAFGGLALKNGQVSSGGPGEHGMETWLRRAKDAGIEFVVVSPNRGDAPDFLHAHWISIRPGTDTAFLLGMAHVLASEGLEDRDFPRPVLHRIRAVRALSHGTRRRPAEESGMGGADLWRRCGGNPRARPQARRDAQSIDDELVDPACAPRRATVLDADHARRDARSDRPAGRRLRVRARLARRRRQSPAGRCGHARAADRQEPCEHRGPIGAPDRYARASGRRVRLQRRAAALSRYSSGLLGRRQSISSSPGSESAATGLAAPGYGGRPRNALDADGAPRGHRSAGDDDARAQRPGRLGTRSVPVRDASRDRSDRRGTQ